MKSFFGAVVRFSFPRAGRPISLLSIAFTIVAVVIASSQTSASGPPGYYDLRSVFVGEQLKGPASVHFAGINPFDDRFTVAATATIVPGITTTQVNAVFAPPAAAAAAPGGRAKPTPPPPHELVAIQGDIQSKLAKTLTQVADDETSLDTTTSEILKFADFASTTAFNDADLFSAYQHAIQVCLFGDPATSVAVKKKTYACPNKTSPTTIPSTIQDANAIGQTWFDAKERLLVRIGNFADGNGGKNATTYANTIKALQGWISDLTTSQGTLVTSIAPYRNLRITDFAFTADESCLHLFLNGKQTKYVVSFAQAGQSADDVTVQCFPPVFITVGIGGDTINNRTYQNVPANLAGQPAIVAPATTPPGIIASSNSGARFLPLSLINIPIPLGANANGDTFAASFGAGVVTNNGGGGKADYVAGLSYYVHRSVGVTLGAAFGNSTALSPGYPVGGQIPFGQTVSTKTIGGFGAFFGITFGVSQ